MAETSYWTTSETIGGQETVTLQSWKYFHDFVTQEYLDFPTYVWRGQRKASWALQSSFDRMTKHSDSKRLNQLANQHLARFKMASRGRRGNSPQRIESDSEWWALAQHNGMATPLLDWTESPFVALYFAFEKEMEENEEMRSVWGIALSAVRTKNREIREAADENLRPQLQIIRPMQDENLRLVSQSGLFTQLPPGNTVDDWMGKNYEGDDSKIRLVKINIPNDGRNECLLSLNRMNINHLSLFPDLYGAGKHCNKSLEISHYSALTAV